MQLDYQELDPKKVNKEKKDQVAMLVQSPDLEQGEQLLGIPESSGLGRLHRFAYDHYCHKKNLPLRSLSRSVSVPLLREPSRSPSPPASKLSRKTLPWTLTRL